MNKTLYRYMILIITIYPITCNYTFAHLQMNYYRLVLPCFGLTSTVDKHKKQIKHVAHDLYLVLSIWLSLKYVNIFCYITQQWWAFFFKQTHNWQRKHLRHIFGYNNFLYSFGNSLTLTLAECFWFDADRDLHIIHMFNI